MCRNKITKKNIMIYIAKIFQGLEDVLYDELKKIGAENIKKERRAVSFEGDLALM